MTNLFTLGHRHHPLSLRMFCILYRTILQYLPPLFLYAPTPIVESSHNSFGFSLMPSSLINCINITIAGAFTTPCPSACIAQFKGLALLVVYLSKLHVISLVIEITCKRSYFCLEGLDA